jgi:nitrile hydratase subunit beta
MSLFATGDSVRIRSTFTMGHSRVPAYARGQVGVVERVLSDFVIPEDDAWGRLWHGGRRATLYRIKLRQATSFPPYKGSAEDMHELEIFEHWLEPAQEATT